MPKVPVSNMHFGLFEGWWQWRAGILPNRYTRVWRHHPCRATPELQKELSKEFTVTCTRNHIRFQCRIKNVSLKDVNRLQSSKDVNNSAGGHLHSICTQKATKFQKLLFYDFRCPLTHLFDTCSLHGGLTLVQY